MSLRKFNFEPSKRRRKIVRRTVLIFVIVALGWRSLTGAWHGHRPPHTLIRSASWSASTVRVGMKTRYGGLFSTGTMDYRLVVGGYHLLLVFGNGFELSEQNIIAVVDKALYNPCTRLDTRVRRVLDPIPYPPPRACFTRFMFGRHRTDNHTLVENSLSGTPQAAGLSCNMVASTRKFGVPLSCLPLPVSRRSC